MVEAAEKRPGAAGQPGWLCVGREAELARLRSLHDRAIRLGGHCVVVQGASGVGKSRLIQEFKRRARLDGVCVLEGHCLPDRRPYQPFWDMVREASGYLADMAPSAFDASQSVGVLEALSGRGLLDDSLRHERWQDERTALYESVGDLFCAVDHVRSPLVILQDVQLADEDTLSLLSYLLSTLAVHRALRNVPAERGRFHGLFVLVERLGGTAAPVTDRVLSGVSHTRLPLSGLDRAGVEAFLTSPTVVDRFVDVTGGNPRHIEALLRTQPQDADRLFVQRVSHLGAPSSDLIEALAVLGHPSQLSLLARVAGCPLRETGAAMDRLLKSELLDSSVREGSLEVSFRSTADQDAVLDSLPDDRRRQLHLAAGREILSTGESVPAAEHLLAGDEKPEDVAKVVLEAGERLELAFAYERAINLYERLRVALPQDAPQGQEVDERLCDLLELTGDYRGAVVMASRLAERLPEDGSLMRRVGHLYLQQGDFSRALEELTLARDRLDSRTGCEIDLALVLSDLAETSFLLGDRGEAERLAETVLTQPPMESLLPQIKARNTLGKVCLERGDLGAAAQTFRENLAAAREAEIIPEEIRALINLGIAHLRAGDLAEAADFYQSGLAAAEASRDYRHRAFCLQNLGVLAHWRRDYTSALQLFHDAIQTFLKLGHKTWLTWIALDLGDLYLELGSPERAEAMLSLSDTLVQKKDDSQTPLFAHMLRGKLAAVRGDYATAEASLQRACSDAASARKSEEEATASIELARLALAQGEWGTALSRVEPWLHASTRKTRAEALYVAAVAWSQLDASDSSAGGDQAASALKDALDLFDALGDPQGVWCTLAQQAEIARRDGRDAAATDLAIRAAEVERRVRRGVPADLMAGYLAHPRRLGPLSSIDALPEEPEPSSERDLDVVPTPATPNSAPASRGRAARPRSKGLRTRYPKILGESEPLRRMLGLVDKIAPIDATVLVRGESGTGKELVAEAIHENSQRAKAPYVTVNCGALVESLLLSELFGHERGAFTGATRRKKGRFELANGGTLFLDEIGDITPKTQVALLRVLQEKEFQRVGGNQSIRVDVRIVCATNRNLEAMVREGSFREDLYYRLKSVQVDVPALRDRGTDVLLLARAWLRRMAEEGECRASRLHADADRLLTSWRWPGNVRELQNVLRSASLLSDSDEIRAADLLEFLPKEARTPSATTLSPLVSTEPPDAVGRRRALGALPHGSSGAAEQSTPSSDDAPDNYAELLSAGISLHAYKKKVEAECIAHALHQTQGNITRAASLLKMKRPRLSQLVKEYGLLG